MTTKEFAARKGCSARTVRRAIEMGLIPPAAVRRSGSPGRRQAVEIVDVALADRSWMPAAHFPRVRAAEPPQPEEIEPDEIGTVSKAWFVDVVEQEIIRSAFSQWGWTLGRAAKAVMAIPTLATERIGLQARAAEALRGLCEDALAVILPGGKLLTKAVVGYIHDEEERAIVEGLLSSRARAGRKGPRRRARGKQS